MKELLQLWLIFAKIGAVTFGGGYAMLPFFQRELCEKRDWCTNEDIMDYYAISQCTPGVIAVNVATIVGKKRKGVLGGIFATLGVVAPSILIITVIAAFLRNFSENEYVKHAFAGIRVGVVVLVLNAIIKFWKSAIKDIVALLLFLVIFVLMIFLDISPVIYIAAAALFGIVYKLLVKKAVSGDGKEERK